MLQQTPPGTNVVVEAGVSEAAEATPLGFAVAEVRHLLPVRPPACAALCCRAYGKLNGAQAFGDSTPQCATFV